MYNIRSYIKKYLEIKRAIYKEASRKIKGLQEEVTRISEWWKLIIPDKRPYFKEG